MRLDKTNCNAVRACSDVALHIDKLRSKSKNMLRGKRDKKKAAAEPKEPRMSFVSMWDQLVDCICRPPR